MMHANGVFWWLFDVRKWMMVKEKVMTGCWLLDGGSPTVTGKKVQPKIGRNHPSQLSYKPAATGYLVSAGAHVAIDGGE